MSETTPDATIDTTTPEQILSTKMQIANSILNSFFKLKETSCAYEKDFLVKGISLNFEYLGRVELGKMQAEMTAASQAMAAAAAQQSSEETAFPEETTTPEDDITAVPADA